VPTTKSTPFVVSEDERDTKEGPGKSMKMHCMYSGMAKGTSQAEAMSNSEKIKPVALAIVELCESEGTKGCHVDMYCRSICDHSQSFDQLNFLLDP